MRWDRNGGYEDGREWRCLGDCVPSLGPCAHADNSQCVCVAPLSNLAVGVPSGFTPEALILIPTLPADNHAQLSRASLRIRILDVNDNPPELATPYEAAVCEDAKPGQVPTGTGDQRCCRERAPTPPHCVPCFSSPYSSSKPSVWWTETSPRVATASISAWYRKHPATPISLCWTSKVSLQ